MKARATSRHIWVLLASLVMIVGCWDLSASAQDCNGNPICPGDNAVYQSGTTITHSHSFIDASQLAGNDLCLKLQTALAQLVSTQNPYSDEGLIDARGISNSGNPIPCSVNPWASSTPYATILLPAGIIQITQASAKWVLPQYTRIIGEGPNATIIQANYSSGDIIDMGSSSVCPGSKPNCEAVAIEHLGLDGGGNSGINGIVNYYSQELSHVNDVAMMRITGIGLFVEGNNSGPYSNISVSGSGSCAEFFQINPNQPQPLYQTRGIHGITCNGTSSGQIGIYVDAPNNSLEDVYVNGYADGILIGDQAPAAGNILVERILPPGVSFLSPKWVRSSW